MFLIVFRRTLPLPADEAARGDSSRDDGMRDDAGDDDGAGREVSVFVDGAPTSSAQAQGRKVRGFCLLMPCGLIAKHQDECHRHFLLQSDGMTVLLLPLCTAMQLHTVRLWI